MIYLASPYSDPDVVVRERRFHQACLAAGFLVRAGHHVYCPVAHTHSIAVRSELPLGWDYWQSYDAWFIERCAELRVIALPGWTKSRGVKAEIAIAKAHQKPTSLWNLVSADSHQLLFVEEI